MRKFHRVSILAIVWSSSAALLHAQSEATKGVIEGVVRGEDGSVLPAVSVTITNQDQGAQRRVQTDMRSMTAPYNCASAIY
jgi:hypothetical protein